MKRLEQLITVARQLSGNTRYDSSSGIPQSLFVQFFNNAQDSLAKEVVNLKTKFFKKTLNVTIVPGQEKYDYPFDMYMSHIDTVQWNQTNSSDEFQDLVQCYTKEKVSSRPGYPFGYILQNDGYYLNPPIQQGVLVLTYSKALPKLQKKNGQISSVTIVANQLTALTVLTTGSYDDEEINDDYFFCVVDKFGKQKAINIEYQSQAAGVFTLAPQTLTDGQTIAVGNSIVIGKNSVNLPSWPDICESYLIKHAVYDAKYNDSSQWSAEAKADMALQFVSLAGSFATLSDDIIEIPVTNTDYIGY